MEAPHGDSPRTVDRPHNPKRMINGNDESHVTVNGGETWSSEDKPADRPVLSRHSGHRFRYYIYGAQQDNSYVAIASRTDHG